MYQVDVVVTKYQPALRLSVAGSVTRDAAVEAINVAVETMWPDVPGSAYNIEVEMDLPSDKWLAVVWLKTHVKADVIHVPMAPEIAVR